MITNQVMTLDFADAVDNTVENCELGIFSPSGNFEMTSVIGVEIAVDVLVSG